MKKEGKVAYTLELIPNDISLFGGMATFAMYLKAGEARFGRKGEMIFVFELKMKRLPKIKANQAISMPYSIPLHNQGAFRGTFLGDMFKSYISGTLLILADKTVLFSVKDTIIARGKIYEHGSETLAENIS